MTEAAHFMVCRKQRKKKNQGPGLVSKGSSLVICPFI